VGGPRTGGGEPLNEDELLAEIGRILGTATSDVLVPPGDDAAVVEQSEGPEVLTTDLLVEGVDFERRWMSPEDLGYRAIVVSVSDVAAMAGRPRHALVALGLSPDVDPAWVIRLYEGVAEAAAEHGLVVVGGDLSRAGEVVVAVTLTGDLGTRGAVVRSGARPGDRIVVTGRLGGAAGGLVLATRDETSDASGEPPGAPPWAQRLARALRRPMARVREGQLLAERGATAMIDVSDGLARDLGRLCRSSGVGAQVLLDRVPVHPDLLELAVVASIDPLELALGGGDDLELLATLPADAVDGAIGSLREGSATELTDIGTIVEGDGLVAVDAQGSRSPLPELGWDHFG
jgi:thiamine-monophosphate kinase